MAIPLAAVHTDTEALRLPLLSPGTQIRSYGPKFNINNVRRSYKTAPANKMRLHPFKNISRLLLKTLPVGKILKIFLITHQ